LRGVISSAASSTLASGGCAHAPGAELAVSSACTTVVEMDFTSRVNSGSRTANGAFLSGWASYFSTRANPSLASAGSYFSPKSMVMRALLPSTTSHSTRIGVAGGPSLPLTYIR
jgi:hypothetical protein